MNVYLDANFVIYLIERHPVWGPIVETITSELFANGDCIAVSDLTRLECQVGPLMKQNITLLNQFDLFFQSPEVLVLPLTSDVCNRAAVLRAKYRFKTPDAIHLAAAIEFNCVRFITNDIKLTTCTEIPIAQLKQL